MWPCECRYLRYALAMLGNARDESPGTHILYDTSKTVAEGGGNFFTRFGVEFEGMSLLAEDSYSKGCELQDGYPEFSDKLLKQLGWWDDLTAEEKAAAEGKTGELTFLVVFSVSRSNTAVFHLVTRKRVRLCGHSQTAYRCTVNRCIHHAVIYWLITPRGTIKRSSTVFQPCTNRFKRKINRWNTDHSHLRSLGGV